MTDAPHVQAAFINALREEGTKEEACDYLQREWNERWRAEKELAAALVLIENARQIEVNVQKAREAEFQRAEKAIEEAKELERVALYHNKQHGERVLELQASVKDAGNLSAALIHTTAALLAAISLLKKAGKAAKVAAPSDKMFDQMILDYEGAADRARHLLNARMS